MFSKKSLAILVLAAFPTVAMAGPTTIGIKPAKPVQAEKSEEQKCRDLLLPQDGVDCLKKLKAKKSNSSSSRAAAQRLKIKTLAPKPTAPTADNSERNECLALFTAQQTVDCLNKLEKKSN